MMIERTCGHSTRGSPRRSMVVSIHVMSPCERSATKRSSCGFAAAIASGRTIPTTSNPCARAFAAIAAFRLPGALRNRGSRSSVPAASPAACRRGSAGTTAAT